MCILFMFASEGATNDFESDVYKLILGMNRDEDWSRPTGGAKLRRFGEFAVDEQLLENIRDDDITEETALKAPIDEMHKGTYIACCGTRFAVLTNVRRGNRGFFHAVANPIVISNWFNFLGTTLFAVPILYIIRARKGKEFEWSRGGLKAIDSCVWGGDSGQCTNDHKTTIEFMLNVALGIVLPCSFFLFAFVVKNYLPPLYQSRGLLVPTFLRSKLGPREFCENFGRRKWGPAYDGFNLIVGDMGTKGEGERKGSIVFMSNRPRFNIGGLGSNDLDGQNVYVREIDMKSRDAIHGLSNAFLNSDWGTLERGKELFSPIVCYMGCRGQNHLKGTRERPEEILSVGEGLSVILRDVMSDGESCRVPVTGRGYTFEEKLARIFVKEAKVGETVYGTRATTFLTFRCVGKESGEFGSDADVEIQMWEKSWDRGGKMGELRMI